MRTPVGDPVTEALTASISSAPGLSTRTPMMTVSPKQPLLGSGDSQPSHSTTSNKNARASV